MRQQGKKRSCERGRSVVAVIGVFLFILCSIPALGQNFGYSYVGSPSGGEKNHAQILHDIYDGTFTRSHFITS